MKNIFFLFAMACFFIFISSSFAQEPSAEVNTITVQGPITEIAPEGTYIVIGEGAQAVKFMTTKEFLEDAYLEVDSMIKAYGEKVSGVVKLVDYEYVLEEDNEPAVPEELPDDPDFDYQDSSSDIY